MLWTDKVNKYLIKLNISSLKEKQIEIINEILLGNDVIGLLPTGYGKSLCYILPPLLSKKCIFIISPLISLMNEQKDKLKSLSINATALNSTNNNKEDDIKDIIDGKIKIVFMSPEYLISNGLKLANILIKNKTLKFLAIDEAHCISSWGHDFRPVYKNINDFRKLYPKIPIMALTATATQKVCDDIINILELKKSNIIRASFDRPNLYLEITEIQNTKNKKSTSEIIKKYMNKYKDCKIIIYINSIIECETIASELNKDYKDCCQAYHAKLTNKVREEIQENFTLGKIKVIISTIAFGMGIDQIVKCVLIFGCPSSIEEYYQQIGRGGRDKLSCETVLYFNYVNLKIVESSIKKLDQESIYYKIRINNLQLIKKLLYLSTCRRKYILEYFGEPCNFFTCNNCDNCIKYELVDITDKLWANIIIKNNNIRNVLNNLDIFNESHIIFEITKSITTWKNYILQNNILQNNISENLKIRIPKKNLKIITNKEIDIFEKYEKYIK